MADAGKKFPDVSAGGFDKECNTRRTTAAGDHEHGGDEKPEFVCTVSVVTAPAKRFRIAQ